MATQSSLSGVRPIIIIGAGRSGTNMLRDLLCGLPNFATWPCDEINYIWRHGNLRWPNDELAPHQATQYVRQYIRRAFTKLAQRNGVANVVEKTCANTLRVAFVDRVLPEARFLVITRDGRDVVASAAKRWTAELDLPYILRKARYVPPLDLPFYASRYFWHRLHRLWTRERRLASWGPRFNGFDEDVKTRSLAELCALQWSHCVDKADAELAALPPERVCRLKYEDVVTQPAVALAPVWKFLDVEPAADVLEQLVARVSSTSVGKGQSQLAAEGTLKKLEELMCDTLARHGYLNAERAAA